MPPRRTFWSPGEGLAWVAALVFALSAFMGWYTVPAEGLTLSVIGWDTGVLGKLVFFVGLAVLLLLVLRAGGFELPPGVSIGLVIAVLGALGTIFVLVRVLDLGDFEPAGRAVGLWISLVAGLALIAAGLAKVAEESAAERS